MRRWSLRSALCCGLVLACLQVGVARAAPSDAFDISAAGVPTITGALGGQVTAVGTDLLGDLQVTVDFGEISPINRNAIIRVVVPIGIRSNQGYEVEVSAVSGGTNSTLLALNLSDIGFGVQNLQPLSGNFECNMANHRITPPYDNDPGVTVNFAGRASYPSSLATLTNSPVILRGPRLSKGNNIRSRNGQNGWNFNAVITLVPQFFAPGTTWVTLTFHITAASAPTSCT